MGMWPLKNVLEVNEFRTAIILRKIAEQTTSIFIVVSCLIMPKYAISRHLAKLDTILL